MCGKWDTVTTRKSGHLRPFGTPPHGSQPPNSGPCYKVSLVIRATCLSLPRTHHLHCMAFPLPPRLRTGWALSLPPMPTTTSPDAWHRGSFIKYTFESTKAHVPTRPPRPWQLRVLRSTHLLVVGRGVSSLS